jgi:DNA polymerase-3 subunit epsilon
MWADGNLVAFDLETTGAAVHGVTTEHARAHGRPVDEVVGELAERLYWTRRHELPLVIYNACYDLTLLDRELRRHDFAGLNTVGLAVVDPLVIDRGVDRYRRGSRKLADTCRHYGVQLSGEDAHTAEGDAVAAARLAWSIAHRYPDACSDLGTLQVAQASWHRTWAAHFEDYLRRQGKPETVSGTWPIRPYVEQTGAVA